MIGVVSLFADATYEGARSVVGDYLGVLGASATIVGVVAGLGELSGYAIRFVSGTASDRTGRYWAVTILGYCVNLVAVPALALAGHWELAAVFMVMERLGKGLRTPARDAMLSHAAKDLGRGWAFGLHEALDQTGAMLGPFIVAGVLFAQGGYQETFLFLGIPAILAITVLLLARREYPRPRDLETIAAPMRGQRFPKVYWTYLLSIAFVAAGFADWSLIAFHLGPTGRAAGFISEDWIPVLYATAMGVDGLAALVFGRLYDRIGLPSLAIGFLAGAFFAPLVFLYLNNALIVIGVVLWGLGIGCQESIMRAAITDMVGPDRRGSGYGVFYTGYGIAWFLGSALLGYLYDVSMLDLVLFSVVIQLLSMPVLLQVWRATRRAPGATA